MQKQSKQLKQEKKNLNFDNEFNVVFSHGQLFDATSEKKKEKVILENSMKKAKKSRPYKDKPNTQLWWAYMQVITEGRLLFISWKYELKNDFFKKVSQKLTNISRNDVKSWNQTQRQNYFLQKNIDMMEAIYQLNSSRIATENEKNEKNEQKQKQFREFQKIYEQKNGLTKYLDSSIQQISKANKRIRQLSKLFPSLAQNQQCNPKTKTFFDQKLKQQAQNN